MGYTVHYYGKITQPTADGDYLPVPSRFDECVLHGSIKRLAGIENRADLLEWSMAAYGEAFAAMKTAMVSIRRSRRLTMRAVLPRRRGSPFGYGNLAGAHIEWTS